MNKFIELAARILLTVIFFFSGLSKIGSYAATQAYMESQGVPGLFLPLVIILELLGPVLVVIGWQTRLAAWALAGFSILTALLFHMDLGDEMQMMSFMKNLAIAGGFLVLAVRGAGELSLDYQKVNKKT